jgi:hypothetical protein
MYIIFSGGPRRLFIMKASSSETQRAEVRVLHMIIFNCTRMMGRLVVEVGRFYVIYGSSAGTRSFDETFTCYGLASTRL